MIFSRKGSLGLGHLSHKYNWLQSSYYWQAKKDERVISVYNCLLNTSTSGYRGDREKTIHTFARFFFYWHSKSKFNTTLAIHRTLHSERCLETLQEAQFPDTTNGDTTQIQLAWTQTRWGRVYAMSWSTAVSAPTLNDRIGLEKGIMFQGRKQGGGWEAQQKKITILADKASSYLHGYFLLSGNFPSGIKFLNIWCTFNSFEPFYWILVINLPIQPPLSFFLSVTKSHW